MPGYYMAPVSKLILTRSLNVICSFNTISMAGTAPCFKAILFDLFDYHVEFCLLRNNFILFNSGNMLKTNNCDRSRIFGGKILFWNLSSTDLKFNLSSAATCPSLLVMKLYNEGVNKTIISTWLVKQRM